MGAQDLKAFKYIQKEELRLIEKLGELNYEAIIKELVSPEDQEYELKIFNECIEKGHFGEDGTWEDMSDFGDAALASIFEQLAEINNAKFELGEVADDSSRLKAISTAAAEVVSWFR